MVMVVGGQGWEVRGKPGPEAILFSAIFQKTDLEIQTHF